MARYETHDPRRFGHLYRVCVCHCASGTAYVKDAGSSVGKSAETSYLASFGRSTRRVYTRTPHPLNCFYATIEIMDQHFNTGSVVGKKSDTHWGQAVKTPYAFGVVEIEDEEGNAQTVGMELIHQITREISEPITEISRIFTFLDSLWKPNIQTLILCIPLGTTMTVILRGTGVVYLKRDGHISRLRSREGTISGVVYPKDTLFLSTKTCLNGVSEEEFFSFFDHLSVEDIAEKLTLHLHTKNDAFGYAGLFVEVEDGVENTLQKEEETPKGDSGQTNSRKFSVPIIKMHALKPLGNIKKKVQPLIRLLQSVDVRITVILLVLFVVSITVGIIKESSGRKITESAKSIQEAERLYDEGVALLDLNLVKSRERLAEAKSLVDKTKQSVSPKTKEGRMLSDLEKKLAEILPKATKEYEAAPELFFDVSLLKNGSAIESFGMYEDTMAFLDTHAKTVYVLQLSTKNGQVVGGGSAFDGSESVAIHGDTVYVFTSNGIHTVSVRDKTVKPLAIKKAEDWLSIKAMTSFGGNIYLLDSGKSRIWKYIATGSAFSPLREYLLPDFFPDLTKATNMAIDGSVWIGFSDGTVKRYTQGKDDPFITKGVEPALGMNLAVFTDDNCTNVYILDPDNKRVVVLEKDGMYKSQYIYPATFIPTRIAVSEKLGKLFFFSEGKLYTTSLK